MSTSSKKRPEAVQRAASERHAKHEMRSAQAREALAEHERHVKAQAVKISQLRALRMAKEAADRDAVAAAPPPAPPRRALKPAAKSGA